MSKEVVLVEPEICLCILDGEIQDILGLEKTNLHVIKWGAWERPKKGDYFPLEQFVSLSNKDESRIMNMNIKVQNTSWIKISNKPMSLIFLKRRTYI